MSWNEQQQRQAQPRKDHVLRLRRSGLKFREIAAELGVSRQRAHQIYREAVRR